MLGEGTYTVRRFGPYSRNTEGYSVLGPVEEFSILASVQPVRGHETAHLPEGTRGLVTKTVYTEFSLRAADHVTGVPADVVLVKGDPYVVELTEVWEDEDDPLAHTKAFLRRDSEHDTE